MRKTLIRPTDAENAAINASALTDPDNSPLTDEQLKQFKRKPGRPSGSAKELVSLRLDTTVLDAFRALGSGWQTRINDVLKDWTIRH
ncbi:MAG: BrnA antitoxin family protein [Pseudomonadota bacterium]